MAMHEYKVSLVIYQTDSMAHGLCEVTTHLRSHSGSSDFGEDEWWMNTRKNMIAQKDAAWLQSFNRMICFLFFFRISIRVIRDASTNSRLSL